MLGLLYANLARGVGHAKADGAFRILTRREVTTTGHLDDLLRSRLIPCTLSTAMSAVPALLL